jgi:hypothetical protein
MISPLQAGFSIFGQRLISNLELTLASLISALSDRSRRDKILAPM